MTRGRIIWLVLFSIAMGLLEAAVVVYLRFLYYPNGFQFPLVLMDNTIAVVELLREAATITMLLSIGYFAGNNFNQRFASFLISFAIWDIFYYIFLKLWLDWPSSLFTWDIPVPWIGPVLAPCLVSLTMIILGSVLLWHESTNCSVSIGLIDWALLIAGSLLIILAWTIDYQIYQATILEQGQDAMYALSTYVPQRNRWWLFGLGELVLLGSIVRLWKTPVRK